MQMRLRIMKRSWSIPLSKKNWTRNLRNWTKNLNRKRYMLLRSLSENLNLATQCLFSFYISARGSRIFVSETFTVIFSLWCLPLWRQNHQKLEIVITTTFMWNSCSDVYVILQMQHLYFLTIWFHLFLYLLFHFLYFPNCFLFV